MTIHSCSLPSVLCLSRASLRVVLAEAFTECTTPLGREGGQVKSGRLGPSVLNAQCAKWRNLQTIRFLKPEVSSMVRIILCRCAFIFNQLLFLTMKQAGFMVWLRNFCALKIPGFSQDSNFLAFKLFQNWGEVWNSFSLHLTGGKYAVLMGKAFLCCQWCSVKASKFLHFQ